MGFIFDIQTGIFTLVIAHLICALLGVAYGIDNRESHIDFKYLLARVIDISAWVALSMRVIFNEDIIILISTSLLIIGGIVQSITLLQMKEKYCGIAKKIYRIIPIISIGIHVLVYQFTHGNKYVVLVTLFLFLLSFWAYPMIILLNKNTTLLQKIIGGVYGITFIAFFYSLIEGYKFRNDKIDGNITILIYSILIIRLLVINVGLILMSKEKMEIKIRYNASYDELTDIMNRRSFIATTNNRLLNNRKENRPIAFLLLDLDDFKDINDYYGHQIGDIVLSDFSNKVRRVIRENDVFGRIGGEEFTILLMDTDNENSYKIAERIRHVVSDALVNNEIHYTVSIGMVTLICDEKTTFEQLYTESDKALYMAKGKGKNCIEHIRLNE